MQFKSGMEVVYRERRMEVLDASGDTVTLIARTDSGEIYECKATELTLATDRPLPLAPAEASAWQEWDQYAQAARKILAAQTPAEKKQRYEESSEQLGLSLRTMQRKVRQFRIQGTVSAMKPEKSGRRTGVRLLLPKVEEIIATQLNERWLKETKPSLTDAIEHIHKECRKFQCPLPSPTTIRHRASQLDEYERIRRREGAKAAKYKLTPMTGSFEVWKLLEYVQIDHTLADVLLVSEFDQTIVIGRPWVTLAIDVKSRMVVGVYISLEPPSAISVGMCLAHAILPKSDFLATLGIDGEWPVHGVMLLVHADNAREFHSEALQNGCTDIGIDLQNRPVDAPHYGGIIERLIGTFMGKCRLLPGSTQRNVVERGDYDAERDARMTLSAFKAFFVNEIVRGYHVTRHRTLDVPPLMKWRELAAEHNAGRPLPSGYAPWQIPVLFYPFAMRCIRRTGIEFGGRFYWADELTEWVGRKEKCAIHFHPGDASKVYLRGPSGAIVVALHTKGDTRCIAFEELRLQRQRNAALSEAPELLAYKDAGLDFRDANTNQAIASTKAAHRAAAIQKTREAQTRDVPLPSSSTPPQSPASTVLVFDRDIRDFGTYRKSA
ncbi:transposase [Dyella acidisoli]|uniref:Transposase n=1 Tax=Dyella acidisoli TaxID=1867834 RepID=A0ABQ5XK18_9GAMM|nr:transposase [Dyella acidisoli]GLQ91990.1 transposase [Dyella acidisoli]